MLIVGIDVSKDSPDCAGLTKDTGKQLGQRSFPNAPERIERLLSWMRRLSSGGDASIHVIVEATACYHELVARSVVTANMDVSVANPARVRSFARGTGILTKTDQIDALVLARYGRLASPRVWKPPAKELDDLQALLSRLDEVEADLRRERNRPSQAQHRNCPIMVLESFLESMTAHKVQQKKLQKAIVLHIESFDSLQIEFKRLMTIPAVGPQNPGSDARSATFSSLRECSAGSCIFGSRASRASIGQKCSGTSTSFQSGKSQVAGSSLHGRSCGHQVQPRYPRSANPPARTR